MKKIFEIVANGNLFGEYEGENADAAIDAYAREAGYEDFADLLRRVPGSTREELEVFEIDTEKLVNAVEEVAGESVFQDNYGRGIALVKGGVKGKYKIWCDDCGQLIAYTTVPTAGYTLCPACAEKCETEEVQNDII